MPGKQSGEAIAEHQSGKANDTRGGEKVMANVPLHIQPLADRSAEILHGVVELPPLFCGALFKNFCWQSGCRHTCDLA